MDVEQDVVRSAPRGMRREPLVGAWLLLVCACVAAMILLGGATRLTDSGLSITEWRLDKQLWPPMSEARWAEEFSLYQQTTEFKEQNYMMGADEFRAIYWWEWSHRFLGLATGLIFALPFLAFWATGKLKGRFWPIVGLFALGGLQGAIGWWMVTSGLFSGLDVSPVRLATHLGMAFIILGVGLWLAMQAFGWPRASSVLGAPRMLLHVFALALFAQIILGALMAGTDAGRAFPDWPTIGGDWLPRAYGWLEPAWRNLVENHATQQFNHRTLGYVVALIALGLAGLAWFRGRGTGRAWVAGLGMLALAQAGLGIAAIVTGVELHTALAHQAGAVAMWASTVAAVRCTAWR